MNRTRCPWCGKIIDKDKDKVLRQIFPGNSKLHRASCSHCGHNYGQILLPWYAWKIGLAVLLILIAAFVCRSAALFIVSFIPCFFVLLMPYSKLDGEGKVCDQNAELFFEIILIDKHGKLKRDELYFFDECFDDFPPFFSASPIYIRSISKKGERAVGELLYMNEKNSDYINKAYAELYDSEMNHVARVKVLMIKKRRL